MIRLNRHIIQQNLVALFAFFMPVSLFFNMTTIILILLLILFIIDIIKREKKPAFFKSPLVLALYFLALLLSLAYSEDLATGQRLTVRSLSFLLLPLCLSTTTGFKGIELKKITLFFYLGNLLAFFMCLLYALTVYETDPVPLQEGFSYFTEFLEIHPSYFSIYFVFSTSAVLFLYRFNTRIRLILKYLLIAFLLFIVLYLRSRAGILAMSAVLLIHFYHSLGKKGYFFLVTVIMAAFLFINKSVFLDEISNRKEVSVTLQERFEIWNASLKIIKRNSLLGVGVGDYQRELDKQYFLDGFDLGVNHRLNSHNQFLQTLLANGIIGFLVLMAIFVLLFRRYLTTRNRTILFFLVSITTLMLFDSVFILQHGILFFVFFAVILLKTDNE